MKHKKTMLGIGIVFLFTLFATLPLFGKGYIPTHDGEYHIIRFIEFFRMMSAGYLFPRWAPTLNSGYGLPIFIFHYPFPNYIGAFIQNIGIQAVDAFKLSLAVGYICAGIFSFLWLKKMFGIKAGVTGAIVGSFVPYWFVDLYVRGSVGEVWAMVFVFAALFLCEYGNKILFSFAIAGLILSHNILAMLFLPFLFGYSFLRKKRLNIWFLFGVLLASYFWIPAILERLYVVGLNTVNFREHFVQLYELIIPSWGTELSGSSFAGNKMSFQIGIMPICILFISFMMYLKKIYGKMNSLYCYFCVVFFVAVCFMMSWTIILWEQISFLQFVQYPWRFLSFIIPTSAFMTAIVSYHIRMRIISMSIIILAIIFSYTYMRPVIYAQRDDPYYLSRKNFTDGTSSMGNSFSTIWTEWKNKRSDYLISIQNGQMKGDFSKQSFLDREFTVASQVGANVSMPILYFPGWSVRLDNKNIPIEYETEGIIQFAVPPGIHRVRVSFAETTIRICGDILSMLTLVCLVGWGILERYAHHNRHISAS